MREFKSRESHPLSNNPLVQWLQSEPKNKNQTKKKKKKKIKQIVPIKDFKTNYYMCMIDYTEKSFKNK